MFPIGILSLSRSHDKLRTYLDFGLRLLLKTDIEFVSDLFHKLYFQLVKSVDDDLQGFHTAAREALRKQQSGESPQAAPNPSALTRSDPLCRALHNGSFFVSADACGLLNRIGCFGATTSQWNLLFRRIQFAAIYAAIYSDILRGRDTSSASRGAG